MTSRSRRTCSAAPLWPSAPTPCGSPTSPTSQLMRAFSIWPPSRTWPRARSWAGQWRITSRRACALTPWSWPSSAAGRHAGSFITATVACKADSSGRRNGLFVGGLEQRVKGLGRSFPVEGFARPCVEGGRHGGDLLGPMSAEVGTFWEVLAQQPVGVLVGGALPGAVRIAEVDLHACVDPEPRMLGHFGALVPGQRPPQLLGQGGDRARDRLAHGLGAMTGKGKPVLHASRLAVARHARQVQQHGEARGALHERADRRAAEAEDEVSFPVTGNSAISRLRRTLADHDLGPDKALAPPARARPRDPQRSAATQAGGQLASQPAAALDEQRLVDSFVADPHGHVVREVDRQAARDLLWAPRPRPSSLLPPSMPAPLPRHRWAGYGGAARSDDHAGQTLLHISAQGRIERKLRRLGPACRPLRVPLRRRGAILQAAAAGGCVAPQLTRDRRRRASEPTGHLLHRVALGPHKSDLLALCKREISAGQ